MKIARLRYTEINIGGVYGFERVITHADVLTFAALIDDHNPLHVHEEFGLQSQFGKNVVHGMLAGSLFSTLVGMYCPGIFALYVSQTLQFRKPLFYGDRVIVRGTVIGKNDSINIVTLKTEILHDEEIMVNGEAKVQVLK